MEPGKPPDRRNVPRVSDDQPRWIPRSRAAALLGRLLDPPVVAAVLARPELETRERRGRRGPALWREDQIAAIVDELAAENEAADPAG